MKTKTRGAVQMILAMTISGTVGWPVLVLGQPPATVVFWRCAFGALAMLATCAALGQLKSGAINRRQLSFAILGGIALVLNWTLLFAAYAHASIAVATVTYHVQPFMLVALGALLFVPAASANSFGVFLFALFVIASGLGCLETAANPYATVLGDAQGAERRLNLAQSFNGLGQFIGPLIGGTLFWWFTARELRRRDIHGALRPRLFNVARRIEGAWNFVWTTNIAHTIWAARNSCTTVLVGVVIGPAAAGLFKIAMTFFDATGTPAKLLEKSFYPEIMRLDPRTKTPWLLGLRSSLLAGGIGLAVAVLMLMVGKPLISAVFGQQYLEAYDLIQIMLGAIIVSMMGFPQESLLFMAGKQRAFLIAQATASAAYIALLVSMAYAFGVQGAAFAYLLGQCLDVLLSLIPTIGAYRNRFMLGLNAPKESNQ